MSMRMRQRGFSLIELVVVVAILGVLAGIGMPLLKTVHTKVEMEKTVSTLASSIEYAQRKAVHERRKYKLEVDNGGYRILSDEQPMMVLSEGVFPEAGMVRSDKGVIFFYPDGYSDNAIVSFLMGDTKYSVHIKDCAVEVLSDEEK